MARFFDDIRTYVEKQARLYDEPDIFDHTTVIVAQNVADYCDLRDPKRRAYLDEEHILTLPSVMPPFPECWVEFRLPEFGQVGWLIVTRDVAEIEDKISRRVVKDMIGDGYDVRWLVRAHLYLGQAPDRPHAAVTWLVSSEGKAVKFHHNRDAEVFDMKTGEVSVRESTPTLHGMEFPPESVFTQMATYLRRAGETEVSALEVEKTISFIKYAVRIAMWTFAFFSIKNITITDHEPPVKPSKKHQARYGVPLTSYKVLKVTPMGRSASDAQGGKHAPPAEHIVRGHFRSFGEEAPLFGRLVGTYWWQPFLRGKAERGRITKDYEVGDLHDQEPG